MKNKNQFLRNAVKILAVSGLLLTILPSILHLYGMLDLPEVHRWMSAGMVVWFVTGSIWLGKKTRREDGQAQS